jgi:hypothetical protein
MTDITRLNHEQRAFFEHWTRPGTDYELIQRLGELRREAWYAVSGDTVS